METYFNLNRNSGIELYEIGGTYIRVKFINSNKIYTYSYESAGKLHIEFMKILARTGKGLNAYINQNVQYLYEDRTSFI